MKPWNGSKVRRRHREPRLRNLARLLRDWLSGFIEETGEGPAQERVSGAIPSSTEGASREGDLRPEAGRRDADTVSRKAFEPSPPEDWLRRVREGAPELLRTLEQNGIAGLAAASPAIESAGPQTDTTSAQTSPLTTREARRPQSTKPTIENASRPSGRTASRATRWIQSWRRKLKPSGYQRVREVTEMRESAHLAAPPAEGRDAALGIETSPDSETSRDVQRQRQAEPCLGAFKSEEPVVAKTRRGASALLLWASRLQLDLPSRSRSGNGKRPNMRPYDGSAEGKKGEVTLLKIAEQSSEVRASAATRAREESSSAGSATPGTADQPRGHDVFFADSTHRRRLAQSSPDPLADAQRGWPAVASVGQFDNQTQENTSAGDFEGVFGQDETNATRPFDPWPALPKYPRGPAVNLAKTSRDAERLHAVDLEQQGGR
jgi:hypothetical protein